MAQLARTSFRERIETLEDEWLSPLAMRSYPAVREKPEPDSDHRTPFQRDRDRIVHSKPFRRLKHKTQVFISPEGDHYRTRLTHTLEACGIARRVARALGLNEDLTEAICARPRPRPPALRPHRRGGARRLRARALGERFPPQRAFTPCGGRARAAEPDGAGARRHPAPHGRRAAGDARGADRPAGGPGGVHQPRHRRRHPRRRPARSRISRSPRSSCSARPGSERIETLVVDLLRHSEEAADIVQGEEVGGAMLRLRSFMFERVYLGERAQARAAAHRADAARAVRPPHGAARRRAGRD